MFAGDEQRVVPQRSLKRSYVASRGVGWPAQDRPRHATAKLEPHRTLVDYYRCPEEFVHFLSSSAPGSQPGFFRFGPEAICYGSLNGRAAQQDVSAELPDALNEVVRESPTVRLGFNPAEVVDNLRLERYCAASATPSPLQAGLVGKLYYRARPFLGVRVRRHLQRVKLANWHSIPFPRWPVDATVEQIHEAMLRLCLQSGCADKVPFIWFWPGRSSGCAILTHDVEASRGRDFCPALMQIDARFGMKSSFQLVPEGRYTLSASFLESMRSQGFEINVHDLNHDGMLFASESAFRDRVRRINKYGRAFGSRGFRSGALYRNTAWYTALEFSYDMSVPNVAHLDPQRGGCCTVTPYFIGDVLELPVTVTQDYSLFHILGRYSIDLWKTQIELILKHHGLLNFIVHPDYIIEKRACSTYIGLLGHLVDLRRQNRVWIALPREVNHWWRARRCMRLVRRGSAWVVEGPEKERATVAYATLRGDRLTYEFA